MGARLARTGSVARSWAASACVVSDQTLTDRSGEVTQASTAWSAWSPSAASARVAATFAVHCGEMADSAAGSASAKAVPSRLLGREQEQEKDALVVVGGVAVGEREHQRESRPPLGREVGGRVEEGQGR